MISEYRAHVRAAQTANLVAAAQATATRRITEPKHRREAVWRFVFTAVNGDVQGFLANLPALNWPGVWRDVFAEIVPVGRAHPDIQHAFFRAWRGWDDWHTQPPIGIDWTIGQDLDGQDQLFVAAMRILLPASDRTRRVAALYRGQSLVDYQRDHLGAWWTICPLHAEWFSRSKIREHKGQGVVLVARNPGRAIVAQPDGLEFIVDPTMLDDVRQVSVSPRYNADEEVQPDLCTNLMGVPVGDDEEGVAVWVSLGMPLPGLKRCADHRLAQLAAQFRMGTAA